MPMFGDIYAPSAMAAIGRRLAIHDRVVSKNPGLEQPSASLTVAAIRVIYDQIAAEGLARASAADPAFAALVDAVPVSIKADAASTAASCERVAA